MTQTVSGALSFIITTYNIAAYIDQCLDSLLPCLRPGDQVIVVDDGSTDTTDLILERRRTAGFGPKVETRLVALGTNTMGGVGIPANIGLSFATRDGVFFVDGDDFLDPAGFLAARAQFDATAPDILIANYLEHNDQTGATTRPADQNRWADLARARGNPDAERTLARSMIAVPWRKFYRRAFLGPDIRFPEGDFFFEDNPFHWQVCRRAQTIAFHDRILCRHRINRPGQTMASTGVEFLAFFDHFDTITAQFDPTEQHLHTAALEWLVNNMSWQIGRMHHGAYWAYAARAVQVLEPRAEIWHAVRAKYAGSAIGGMVEGLVRGQIAGTVAAWMADRTQSSLRGLETRLSANMAQLTTGSPQTDAIPPMARLAEQVQSLYLISEFTALRAVHDTPLTPDTKGEVP